MQTTSDQLWINLYLEIFFVKTIVVRPFLVLPQSFLPDKSHQSLPVANEK